MFLLISTEQNTHFSIAIGDNFGVQQIKTINEKYQQSELLLDEIQKLIGDNTVSGLIVVHGPGAFSALRIGIATANALAYAWQVPVVGVTADDESKDIESAMPFLYEEGLLLLKKAKKNKFVTPEYGREPNIT